MHSSLFLLAVGPRSSACPSSLSRTKRPSIHSEPTMHLSSNGDLNLNTGLDVDDDLLDNLSWGVQVDEALVDAHLEAIPGLGSLSARSLTGGDLEGLGWESDWSLEAEVL